MSLEQSSFYHNGSGGASYGYDLAYGGGLQDDAFGGYSGYETASTAEYGAGVGGVVLGGSGGISGGYYSSSINGLGLQDASAVLLASGIGNSGYYSSSVGGNYGLGGFGHQAASLATHYATDAQGLYQDPNPHVIRRPAPGGAQTYTQRVSVRFLQPPPVPPPGPLIIKEVRPIQPPPPPPLYIRQRPPPPPVLPPVVIREAPPRLPPPVATQVITRMLPPIPVPPRSVIIERLPPLPPKPRDIIVERWLPYRVQHKRRVILQRAPPPIIPKPRNIIIYYEPPRAQVVRRFVNMGVACVNPAEYVARYGTQLEDAHSLISHARQAGVVEDISPPAGAIHGLQSANYGSYQLGGAGYGISGGLSTVGGGGYSLGSGYGLGGVGGYSLGGAGGYNLGGAGGYSLGGAGGYSSGFESSAGDSGYWGYSTGLGSDSGYEAYSSEQIYELLKKADQISQLHSHNNSQEKIDIYHEVAQACQSIGNYDEAIKYYNLELYESQLADLHDDILYCYRFLGECYLYKNEFYTSERYYLNFLSLAKQYNNNERIEQAYTCLANIYWIWLSYLQDDILYDCEYDQFPRDLCKRSFDAAKNSLLIIKKLDHKLEIDIKEKRFNKIKDIEQRQQDLALKRVRSYINIANVMSEKYLNDGKDNANLQTFSQYIKNANELSKKYNFYEELARLHSSVSGFYLCLPNYLQYKQEIIATMKQAIHYAQLTKNTNEYLSCLYDIAQTFISFDEYEEAKIYLMKIYHYKKIDDSLKEKVFQDITNIQHILTGLENDYENEINLRKKIYLAEKCADIFSHFNRYEQSKNYYLKQLKHSQELNLDENHMATIYSSLGCIYQDLKEWQLSIDYFRREMSCRIGLDIHADIEQGYSLCEIIKCEYRLKIDLNSRIRTFQRVLTIARSTNDRNLIRMAVALVFAMKLRNSHIYLNDDLEEFIANIQPPITEENYSEILRCSECYFNEITNLIESHENLTDNDDDNDEENHEIIQNRKDLMKINSSHENRLNLACKEKNGLEKIKQYIIEGDNINILDCHGWTPLHNAAYYGHIDIVRYLLDHKANINARTNNGITALINACYNKYFDIIEILLIYGAQIDIRTNNGYTAIDYLIDYNKNISLDDHRKLNCFKEQLLATIRKNEPIYCIQQIIRNDFDNKQTLDKEKNSQSYYKTIRTNRNMITNQRVCLIKKRKKFFIDTYENNSIANDSECIETISRIQKEHLHSPLYTPEQKRQCTMTNNQSLLSNDIEIFNTDNFDFMISFQKNSPISSFQTITPKSTIRSRQTSTTSSINTTILLSPSILHDTNTRIIRCLANTSDRTIQDKRLRIPISSSDTITNLRYQVLKRLYDNFNIYACFVTLYDRQDWELGIFESDTIQLTIPADESDIKAIYIEKNPIIVYEEICKEKCLVVYSNIRSILKIFFDKFELSLQRLSLKLEQAISILKVFENFMFIYSIDLSDQLKSLNLSKNKFTSNGIGKLFEEKTMNNLLILDLSENIDIDYITLIFLRTRFPNLTIYH
ncbi:unnamed protein product [Rotaria sordida]|uniref:Tonsoku-like protein n=1 Tax=Rotaria sordida TaxID=392033 RepID=A0A814DKT0_9BILA|nr:unnamed protein product [Rotaria sordida]